MQSSTSRRKPRMNASELSVVIVLLAGGLSAQWVSYPAPGTPRTRDGKPNLTAPAPRASNGKPDLSGLWHVQPTGVAEMKRLFGDDLIKAAEDVADTFTRIALAVRTINDERLNLPDISDTEPQRLSFLVAAAMEVDVEVKQELLELRSTAERLERLKNMLDRAVEGYEERARIHELAKGNGHSGKNIDIE